MALQEIIPQKSEQWHRLRLGKFTSSMWHLFNVQGKTKGEPSAGVKTYITQLLWELICGHGEEVNVWQTKHGNEWEPFAMKEVEKRYKSEYFVDTYVQHPTLPYYGGSPDGFILINGINTIPEIKCPTGKEHLINIQLLKDVETCKKEWPEIYGQCQSNMNLRGDKMALAVSFQHEAGHLMYKDLMIPRDEEYISLVMSKMATAWEYMQEQAKKYGIDILAKYDEYSKPLVNGMQPLNEAEAFNHAA